MRWPHSGAWWKQAKGGNRVNVFAAMTLALVLHRDPALVAKVWSSWGDNPPLNVAVVEGESWFNPHAFRVVRDHHGKRIGTAWGLYQLVDIWHEQSRDDLDAHIRTGSTFLAKCWVKNRRDVPQTLLAYNGGEDGYVAYVTAILDRVRFALLLDQRYGARLADR
jgi:hypothetical protein